MTAEVAVMNKLAIALAADSAVTITTEEGMKLYNTDKLFMLSKYQPLGVMIFGNSALMGVPWELIIKSYRSHLGKKSFDELEHYSVDFFKFLTGNRLFFPEDLQMKLFQVTVLQYLSGIFDRIVEKKLDPKETILKIEKTRSQYNRLSTLPGDFEKIMRKRYDVVLDEMVSKMLEGSTLGSGLKQSLKDIGYSLFTKDKFPKSYSGIVFAGYGHKQAYPRAQSFMVHTVIADVVRYAQRAEESQAVSEKMAGGIGAFAQREEVQTFMEGVSPKYQERIDGVFKGLFESYPNIVEVLANKLLPGISLTETQKKTMTDGFLEIGAEAIELIDKQLGEFRQKEFVSRVMNVVSNLPKDELAALAESLVYLTSLKRKFSIDAETVGGPIDVALISKGDGFVWVKRKHYFKPELNHHFFNNYFEKDAP